LFSSPRPVADNTIPPWLTGSFFVEGFDNFGLGENSVFVLSGPPFFPEMTFSPPANLPSQTTEICDPIPSCNQLFGFTAVWNGSAIGGAVRMFTQDMSGQPISLTGWMTGGVISGFRQEVMGIEDIYINEWQFDFTFRGIWSNGWWSEGSSSIHVGTSTDTEGLLR